MNLNKTNIKLPNSNEFLFKNVIASRRVGGFLHNQKSLLILDYNDEYYAYAPFIFYVYFKKNNLSITEFLSRYELFQNDKKPKTTPFLCDIGTHINYVFTLEDPDVIEERTKNYIKHDYPMLNFQIDFDKMQYFDLFCKNIFPEYSVLRKYPDKPSIIAFLKEVEKYHTYFGEELLEYYLERYISFFGETAREELERFSVQSVFDDSLIPYNLISVVRKIL